MPLTHHELCFGCGTTNLFGLQLELERAPDGSVAGRFFVKQDHQGARGVAHPGILAAALEEAAALAAGEDRERAPTGRLEVDFLAPAPIGAFVALAAAVESGGAGASTVTARARGEDGVLLARAKVALSGPIE